MRVVKVFDVDNMRLEDSPKPENGKNSFLLQVENCAVCGTDVKIITQGHKLVRYPVIPGHEFAAKIVDIGSEIKKRNYPFVVGDRVVMSPGIPCGRCRDCLDGNFSGCGDKTGVGFHIPGGFAEYMVLPERAVYSFIKYPGTLSSIHASIMEPVACCLHGQRQLTINPWNSVVIIGAGAIGAIHAELARVYGAVKIIVLDVLDTKLELIKQINPNIITINPDKDDVYKQIMDTTQGKGVESVIIACASKGVYPLALTLCKKGGTILFFAGLSPGNEKQELDINTVHYRELKLIGTFGSAKKEQAEALGLLERGLINVDKIITHTMPLERIENALQHIKTGTALKVVLTMQAAS
jgi:L-iditol 2-dehydrogenase